MGGGGVLRVLRGEKILISLFLCIQKGLGSHKYNVLILKPSVLNHSSSRRQFLFIYLFFFFIFQRKQVFTFHVNHLLGR